MQIPVLVESVSGNGFWAWGGEPLALSAEGMTRDEAIARLKSLIADRLAFGAELISLDVENHGTSAGPCAGMVRRRPIPGRVARGRRELSTRGRE